MTKALIITSYVEHLENINLNPKEYGAIICADAGLLAANRLGITATHLIGDYESEHNKASDGKRYDRY